MARKTKNAIGTIILVMALLSLLISIILIILAGVKVI